MIMASEPPTGERVVGGRYEIAGELGRGGMGVVWLATDRVLQREVALKEISYPVHLTDEERAVLRERTLREARAAARLEDPHVVAIHDVLEEDGRPWLVMEHVRSRSLQRILQEDGPMSPVQAARIGLDLLSAIEVAHAAGVVHRDVKPANVLVSADGQACLTDFGIATTTDDATLTTQGAVLGSPSYMAPERAQGEPPTPAVDLWSLGATLYAAVEGRPPFDRGEAMATLMSVVSEDPAPMVRAGPLEPVLTGLLTKDPDHRATVVQTRRLLEDVQAGGGSAPQPPPQAPPVRHPMPGGSVQRLDADDLRQLASASRSLLGSVLRDARDEAKELADRQRQRKAKDRRAPVPGRGEAPPQQRPRWRFKRRWVVVPLVVTVVLLVLVAIGVAVGLAALFGLI